MDTPAARENRVISDEGSVAREEEPGPLGAASRSANLVIKLDNSGKMVLAGVRPVVDGAGVDAEHWVRTGVDGGGPVLDTGGGRRTGVSGTLAGTVGGTMGGVSIGALVTGADADGAEGIRTGGYTNGNGGMYGVMYGNGGAGPGIGPVGVGIRSAQWNAGVGGNASGYGTGGASHVGAVTGQVVGKKGVLALDVGERKVLVGTTTEMLGELELQVLA